MCVSVQNKLLVVLILVLDDALTTTLGAEGTEVAVLAVWGQALDCGRLVLDSRTTANGAEMNSISGL